MTKFMVTFDENEARNLLNIVNERIAGIFCKPKREVRFVFLSYISSRHQHIEVLGQCLRFSDFDEVQIKLCQGWQATAIHELAHVYNPGITEKKIREITADLIKFLKRFYTK